MNDKQLIVKRQFEYVDVGYASENEILQICKNLTGAEIKYISISDTDYPNYSSHAKDFLTLGHTEGWQFTFYSDYRKDKQIEESFTAYPLETAERACRVACDEFRIFKNLKDAMSHNFNDAEITKALENQYEIEQEAWYGAIRH
jgi:hypothetical protein